MSTAQDPTLTTLKKLLIGLRDRHTDSFQLSVDDVPTQLAETATLVSTYRKALQINGLVLIKGGISDNSLAAAKEAAVSVVKKDFGHLLPAEEDSSDGFELDAYRSSKCGRGNASFGFLFRQPETWQRSESHNLEVAGENTAFSKSSSYYDCNINLICHESNQKAFAILYALTNKRAMISADSVKFCSFKTRSRTIKATKERYTPTKRKYTAAHIDKYTNALNRYQAMIFGKEEGDVTLCFVRFSHLLEVQDLISTYLKNPSFFSDAKGFFLCDDERLFDTFREAGVIVVPEPTDLVIWSSSVIHVELHRETKRIEPLKNIKNGQSLRYVVGTHVPAGLSDADLQKLAVVAVSGFVPHPYVKNGPIIDKNNVSKKKTMFKKLAPTCKTDTDTINNLASLSTAEISKKFETLHPRVKHAFGLSQSSAASLFTDTGARTIFLS